MFLKRGTSPETVSVKGFHLASPSSVGGVGVESVFSNALLFLDARPAVGDTYTPQDLLPEDVKTGYFMSSATKGSMQMVTGAEWVLHEDNLPDFEWVPPASSITSKTEMWVGVEFASKYQFSCFCPCSLLITSQRQLP